MGIGELLLGCFAIAALFKVGRALQRIGEHFGALVAKIGEDD